MDLNQTDYGQIEIFDNYFENVDPDTIKNTPIECIERKLTYYAIYNSRILPVMIGSKLSEKHVNPLGVKGYFIIEGMCYSVNNIMFKLKHNFSKYNAYFSNGSKIYIQDMLTYYIQNGKTKTLWYLPLNWESILNYTKFPKELKTHLSLIFKLTKHKIKERILEEENLLALAKMFECWLGLIEEPEYNFRLITAGEIINDALKRDENIINCFLTSNWTVKYIFNVTSVSELMKHYNVLQDIESIRRITYPSQRKTMRLNDRQVKFNNKFKICPVHTPDGELTGTVLYLCKDAKITITDVKIPSKPDRGDNFVYLDGKFYSKTDDKFIKKHFHSCDIIQLDNLYFISTQKGRIIPSDTITSYSGTLIPYFLHNPPVRTTFVCSMMKQAITVNPTYERLINDTKILLNSDTELGNNLRVAIMPWHGFNIEDSVVISEKTVEKFKYKKTYIYREKENIKYLDFKLKIGQRVYKNQLLYKTYDDDSIQKIGFVYSKSNGVVVECENRVIIEDYRELEVGDKMSSKHGQKGVISLIEKEENMPYIINSSGQKEYIELIVNPHAFPSRMTMGQIKEMGERKQNVYIKGTKIKNDIFVGKCEYMALRHQVGDKIQFYNTTVVDPISKQPKGIRFGQMERDILIGLNATKTLKELWEVDRVGKKKQSYLICLSYLKALNFDIKIENGFYSIIPFENKNKLPKCKYDKIFGANDVTDLRLYKDEVILPICLRSAKLEKYYRKSKISQKEIQTEIKRLLVSKEGAFHKYFEGHLTQHCMRSVITPNPKLNIDEVEIPFGVNLGADYCILNRQPSLNISSLRLMKIKYKKERSISFNPLLCKSFNADFDGDEMNLFGIINTECVQELKEVLYKEIEDTQDYILMKFLNLDTLLDLTLEGITPDKEGVSLMIKSGSKGKSFNFEHIYMKIGEVFYNGKGYNIINSYNHGLSIDEWYILSMISRDSTSSIALNTPVSGYLQSLTNQLLL